MATGIAHDLDTHWPSHFQSNGLELAAERANC
jgi:hypothetical protein